MPAWRPAIIRFAEKIRRDSETGCWLWTGPKNWGGYGFFTFKNRLVAAHKWAYWCWVGPVAKGVFVCHSCDQRDCVNPSHMWLGNAKSNAMDMVGKRRSLSGH